MVTGRSRTPTDHLALLIDAHGMANISPEGTQVGHRAFFPEKGVDCVSRARLAGTYHLSQVVDSHHLDVLAAGFGDRPQDVAANTAKPVDGDPYRHGFQAPG